MERTIPIVERCAARSAAPTTVFWLQGITSVWMLLECAVSLYAATRAHSVALLTFGADSLVELLSASVVLLSFVSLFPINKRTKAVLKGQVIEGRSVTVPNGSQLRLKGSVSC